MQPWFIATKKFDPSSGPAWQEYLECSGLSQLDELLSLDPVLCPTVLPDIKDTYWPHIVNEDFMLNFFLDLDFLLEQASGIAEKNVLGVFRNPPSPVPSGLPHFGFVGYDLVDVTGSASALSNCGGFPEVFANAELSPQGLLKSHARAVEVQARLRELYPTEDHADCHVWAIFRLIGR
ncbi:MAG TPA: hypothetical protein VIY51_14495 [Xanthobacteraceae bacterium]